MEIFRISNKKHSKKLSASGSANRWNFDGQNVIYAGSSRSLSTLELIVHKNAIKPKVEYKVMIISLADIDHLVKQIMIDDLPSNWRKMAAYSVLQKIGSDWYENQESLVLKVPSAVIPHEYNYIINTEHTKFSEHVQLVRIEDYFWDTRLF
ncbi:RES family NAD+ phosphorylase [Patescibacteria group bacterium]|nr:RES family NAD+ phosphorylase [Patescibacteria group bacterium]